MSGSNCPQLLASRISHQGRVCSACPPPGGICAKHTLTQLNKGEFSVFTDGACPWPPMKHPPGANSVQETGKATTSLQGSSGNIIFTACCPPALAFTARMLPLLCQSASVQGDSVPGTACFRRQGLSPSALPAGDL